MRQEPSVGRECEGGTTFAVQLSFTGSVTNNHDALAYSNMG